MATFQAATETTVGLRRDAIGLREVLFQSITDMAPGAAIAASIPAGAAFAGGSLTLSVVFALIACLLCAWCVGELARELPSAGSLATYAARGIHSSLGFLVAWAYATVGALIPPLVLLQLGFTVAATLHSELGVTASLWWPWTILGALLVGAAGYFGIQVSARMGTILGVFEILVFVVLGVLFVIHAGSANTGQVFTTQYTPKSYAGITGVIAGSVYTVLAFGGFEGAAPLAEEARDPRRTVRRAVLLATLSIGLLYVFTTYAVTVVFGPHRFSSFLTSGPSSWEGLARSLFGFFWFFVFLAIVNSTIANSNAGVNVASRTAYAMGRVRAFPSVFATVSQRHRSPLVALATTIAATLGVSLGLGFGYGPTVAFSMVGAGLVILLVSVYLVTDAACIAYFLRIRRFRLIAHGVIPVLGILAFIPAWLTATGIHVFSFISPLTPPISYMAYGIGGFMALGVVYLVFLWTRERQRVVDVGIVHLDLAADEQPQASS
ncbi:MAG: APC family permease [Solirubrobacterales bacterium]|nr:APC family permease [Solirubrobacterales bacterium]